METANLYSGQGKGITILRNLFLVFLYFLFKSGLQMFVFLGKLLNDEFVLVVQLGEFLLVSVSLLLPLLLSVLGLGFGLSE